MSTSGGSSGGGSSPITVATLTIPNTSINALFSVPLQIVAAPGANKGLAVVSATLEAVPGAVGNWIGNGIVLYYGTTPTTPAVASTQLDASVGMTHGDALPNPHVVEVAGPASNSPFTATTVANESLTVAMATADPQKVGGLTAVTINDAGTDYAPGDTGTIDADLYGGSAAYVVDTVGALGVVTALHLSAAGTGYAEGDTAMPTTPGGSQPGVGTGLLLDFATVVQPLGNLYVTVAYRTITTH